MKKKVFAALCAGAMLCGMVSMPVSAWETKYTKGDINMDGKIDGKDIMAGLKEFTYYYCGGMEHYLTEEQIERGDILPDSKTKMFVDCPEDNPREITTRITLIDVHLLQKYYTYAMVDPELREKDIVEWVKESNPQLWAKYEK
ncbi:MAG: hypothetical protein IJL32_15840 [Oscillospiraceae bacterium]|nr:hypothetical protein [Oscillospiraceae bacterium]